MKIYLIKFVSSHIIVIFALAWFALSPTAQALNPPPGGGYANGTTAVGTQSLLNLTSGIWNTALGFQALNHDTVGGNNTATGVRALFNDTSGSYNSATGIYALYANVDGWFNNAVGAYALANNVTGDGNTAVGYVALWRNTADYNTATGFAALYNNTTGVQNVANGYQALLSNTTASENVAIGAQALFNNTTGDGGNTATGFQALYTNTIGAYNVANGKWALYSNTTGRGSVACGGAALNLNTTGSRNTADGTNALNSNTTGWNNTGVGLNALIFNTTGNLNTALGEGAGQNLTTGNNNIEIGNLAVAGEVNTIRIGTVTEEIDIFSTVHPVHNATYIAGISGQTASGGVAVYINSDGKLGTLTSSARFKTEIKPMDEASEAILALKPVTFRYKHEIDSKDTPQFGLVAEDVEKVNPDLVARDADGKVYTVRYEAVNAMLLNEFLKEHRQLEDLKAIVAEQQRQIKALTSGLQKVSTQVELNRAAPQTVLNNQR